MKSRKITSDEKHLFAKLYVELIEKAFSAKDLATTQKAALSLSKLLAKPNRKD